MALAVVVAGCDDPDSEEGQVAFSDSEFSRDHDSGDRVLLGTRYCPEFSIWFDEDGSHSQAGEGEYDELRACFTDSLTGPGTLAADGCISFDDLGEVVWELEPQDCQLAQDHGVTFVPDRVRFLPVAAEDVAATVSPWVECYVLEDSYLEPDPEDAFAQDWVPGRDAPVLVAAGQPFLVEIVLAAMDACDQAGWSIRGASIDGQAAGAQIEPGDKVHEMTVTIDAGTDLDLVLELPDLGDFPVSRIQGVSPEVVTTLEVVALYGRGEEDMLAPFVVRGIARDADGNLVRAAPIEWSLDAGRIVFNDEDYGPEYVLTEDVCVPPGTGEETRSAAVTAQLGDLEASINLTWTVPPASASDEPFEGDERCPPADSQGCGCGLGSETSGPAMLLGLLLLARRRRA
jgi:MYXO-CTERM domain-containing protein